jgi:hypothetical protein
MLLVVWSSAGGSSKNDCLKRNSFDHYVRSDFSNSIKELSYVE